MHRTMISVLLVLASAHYSSAQTRVEKNIIYGMYSGLALLMDVHRPEKPNGYGVIFVSGSGWQAPLTYGAVGLKEGQIGTWSPPLLSAGYTVFAINHRAAPRFHEWELELSPHLLKRMTDRQFTEVDLRRMLKHAKGHRADIEEGRWVIDVSHKRMALRGHR